MIPTFCLAIPHAAWLPERARMQADLLEALEIHGRDAHTFADREHWSAWFVKILRWGVEARGTHLLVLQDDVEVSPHFWEALGAMVTAWPSDLVSLAATHSIGPEVARQGRRSYLTKKVVGWGYVLPMALVRDLLEWCLAGNMAAFRERLPTDGEDTMIGQFLHERGLLARCPVPTIIDHRFCASTNPGFDEHTHRRSTVTWRGFAPEDMATPEWWLTTAAELPPDDWRRCWWCGERPEGFRSAKTGALVCGTCVLSMVGASMGLTITAGATK